MQSAARPAPGSPSPAPDAPSFAFLGTFLGGLALALFFICLTGLPNLVDNERRVGAYILDALHNGHVMAQRDSTGDVISKPPMITWLSALATLPVGHLNRFSLYFPGALAAAALGLVLLRSGTRHFGWVAGFVAGLSYLLSPIGYKVVQTARYDGLFALPVTLAALAAYRSWVTGRGWTWFWLAAAWATLIKGPLGLILGAAGLVAYFWEWRSGNKQPLRGSHWLGIALFLILCGGWLWLAYQEMGQPLFDKLFKRELMQHALKGSAEEGLGVGFWEPTVSFLRLYAPWSILGVMALWRVVKHPAADLEERRLERFLFCWFVVGLILFSAAAHQRSRLVMPIVPALALLAGREAARYLARWRWDTRRILRWAGASTLVVLVIVVGIRHFALRNDSAVLRTQALQDFAAELRATHGTEFPITYMDAPFALQFRLNTLRFEASPARAAELLRGPIPAFVATGDDETYARLQQLLGSNAPPIHVLRELKVKGRLALRVVSNQPRFEWPAHTAFLNGPLRLETREARLLRTRRGEMQFERRATNGTITVTNEGRTPQDLRLRLTGLGAPVAVVRKLEPGQSWRSDAP